MKIFLTRLLLALSLLVNSVAVLASGFQGMGVYANPATVEMSCDAAGQQPAPTLAVQHDGEKCTQPCCDDSACSMQGICIVQHNTFYVEQAALKFSRPVSQQSRDAEEAAVPEFKLPPENPPPIHA